MKKLLHSKKVHHWFFRSALVIVLLIVLIDALSFTISRTVVPLHSGPPTFTVCHAVKKDEVGERYYCSNDGCYSDGDEEMTVIGSYEDGNTCAGIAENLGE